MVQPVLNGIHIESYLRVKWLNPSLTGIDVESHLWV